MRTHTTKTEIKNLISFFDSNAVELGRVFLPPSRYMNQQKIPKSSYSNKILLGSKNNLENILFKY